MLEHLPKKYHATAASILSANYPLLRVYATIYFYYISKDWLYWMYFSVVFMNVVFILSLFLFESAKYYISRGRFDEARETFTKIARVNGSHHVFEEPFREEKELNAKTDVSQPSDSPWRELY